MRAIRKAVFPALLTQVHRHKKTENREAATSGDTLQMLGREAEAKDSALVNLLASNTAALCVLDRGG